MSLSGCLAGRPAPATPVAEVSRPVLSLPSTASPTTRPNPTATPRPPTTATPRPATPTATRLASTPTPPITPAPSPAALAGTSCDIEHVLIISVDGLRPDALAQAETPVLDGLRRQGMYTAEARTVVPSVTLIGHASMLGGLGPDKHGIFWNIDNAGLGKIKGPTLFSVASQAGLSAVMVVGKPRLEDIVLPGSVETFDYAGYTDQQVVEAAMPWLVGKLPAILFIHLPDVDSAGHASGWMSAEQLLTISQTDQRLGQMVEALAGQGYLSQTLLLITSDHGGANQAHGQDTAEDTTIPWLAVGPGVPHNGVITADVIIYDTAATALYALDLPRPAGWDGQPILEIFDKRACQP